jgi:hypothetical protein
MASCIRLAEDFKIKSSNSTLSNRIKLNGYYYYSTNIPRPLYDSSSKKIIGRQNYYWIIPLVFYEDGLAYFQYRGTIENKIYNDSNYYMSLPHTNLKHSWNQELNSKLRSKKDVIGWGRYEIKEDSIFIEYYDRAWENTILRSNKLVVDNLKGIILNDTTLLITRHWGQKELFHFIESEKKLSPTNVKRLINRH